MHAELASGSALIALVFLEHSQDEPLLELAYCLGIQNVAFVHLDYECFELISHGISLSRKSCAPRGSLTETCLSLNLFPRNSYFAECCSRPNKSSPL